MSDTKTTTELPGLPYVNEPVKSGLKELAKITTSWDSEGKKTPEIVIDVKVNDGFDMRKGEDLFKVYNDVYNALGMCAIDLPRDKDENLKKSKINVNWVVGYNPDNAEYAQ